MQVNPPQIYLDYAAASPLDEKVLSVMRPYFSDSFYNPSSPYLPAVQVRREYESAKHQIASAIGCKADELIMTAGATESINLAFAGVKGHVVTSEIEHHAVLAATGRHEHTLVKPADRGRINADAVKNAITDSTELVSIGLANNELGTIQPIRAIAATIEEIREKRVAAGNKTPLLFHSDASQGFGLIDIHVSRLGVDLLTLNAAKIYGPKQVGLLFKKPTVDLAPVVVGGGQESGLRSGTENVAGVIGFAEAARLAVKRRTSEATRLGELRDKLQDGLERAFSDMEVLGDQRHRLPNFLTISFPGVDAERLIFLLEAKGVLVATGSACAANKGTQSHVLKAIGLSDDAIDGSLRLSLGKQTTEEMIDQALEYIIEAVNTEKKRVGRA